MLFYTIYTLYLLLLVSKHAKARHHTAKTAAKTLFDSSLTKQYKARSRVKE